MNSLENLLVTDSKENLSSLISNLMKPVPSTELGWDHKHTHFVLPYDKNIARENSLSEWIETLDALYQTADWMIFPILCSLGSPILGLMKWQSAVVNLTGPSGRGKTSLLRFALSVWGNPKETLFPGHTPMSIIEKALYNQKDMPVAFDDCQSQAAIKRFILMSANGLGIKRIASQHRKRGKNNKSFIHTWNCTPLMASNISLLNLPRIMISDQIKFRVLELPMTISIPSLIAERINNTSNKDYGEIGLAFMNYVNSHKNDIIVLADHTYNNIYSLLRPEQRFLAWTLTSAVVAFEILKKSNIYNPRFPSITPLISKILNHLTDFMTGADLDKFVDQIHTMLNKNPGSFAERKDFPTGYKYPKFCLGIYDQEHQWLLIRSNCLSRSFENLCRSMVLNGYAHEHRSSILDKKRTAYRIYLTKVPVNQQFIISALHKCDQLESDLINERYHKNKPLQSFTTTLLGRANNNMFREQFVGSVLKERAHNNTSSTYVDIL